MEMKKMMRRSVLLLAGMLIAFLGCKMDAKASGTYPADTGNGTITITKYEGSATGWENYGTTQSPSGTLLNGAEYTIRKVGTVSQTVVTQTAADGTVTSTVQLEYTLEADVATALGIASPCSSTDLDNALKNLANVQTIAEGLVSTTSTATGVTGDGGVNGQVVFSGLNHGLYLVVETDAPATVTAKSVPFFVSIPSVVYNTSGNTTWTTSINAYPKNNVGSADISKVITNGTDSTYTYAAVGDMIAYKVPFNAPIPAGGLKQLYIVDTLSDGLTYTTGTLKVYQTADGSEVASTNYTVDTSVANTVKVTFSDAYLSSLSGDAVSLYLAYECTLNANAILGTTGNANSVDLYYSNSTTVMTAPSAENATDPKVYTYGIQITKTNGSGTALQGVQFTLTDANGNQVGSTIDGSGNVTTGTGTTPANGVLSFAGLKSGTYTLTEVKTNSGYILLKEPITVVIASDPAIPGQATANVGGQAVTMIADPDNTGSNYALVPLTVVNDTGFSLPATGGSGTAIFAFVGILLVVVAGVLLFLRRKK